MHVYSVLLRGERLSFSASFSEHLGMKPYRPPRDGPMLKAIQPHTSVLRAWHTNEICKNQRVDGWQGDELTGTKLQRYADQGITMANNTL